MRNEAETRAELIDPHLHGRGWAAGGGTRVRREVTIDKGRLEGSGGRRAKPLIADYILQHNHQNIAVLEAKSEDRPVGDGVAQAKNYALKLRLRFAFASNGHDHYMIDMHTGKEGPLEQLPTPAELLALAGPAPAPLAQALAAIPYGGSSKTPHYYQEIAISKTLEAIASGSSRVLLTLATGTGKTFIASQIAWKLFEARWNLQGSGTRRPRILFLADRNILADQAKNAFDPFPEEALVRINPGEIRKDGRVPTNGSVFFTIFQTFMSGPDGAPNFGSYPPDFFDLIIIDECHRGGANDESNWRGIMEYFGPAVQLGLTATPKRAENADTYKYFGEPVFTYSLKEGINDGFLTPFKVRRIQTTLDTYTYTPDDKIIEGEIEEGKTYTIPDFNRIIEIKEREQFVVKRFMQEINQAEKGLVFCATQDHAAAIRDLVNRQARNPNPHYCARVTANDGELGEQYLREFQDSERTIPTMLTTSQKLSTGVDARNVRNIILLRPINSMIEFKQIIGRGTRLFEGKDFFTIYDFVGASHHFEDPEWDGEPLPPDTEPGGNEGPKPPRDVKKTPPEPTEPKQKLVIRLADGKAREIDSMASTLYYDVDGMPLSARQFMEKLFGQLPAFFESEEQLRQIWSLPSTRKTLLDQLSEAGFGSEHLRQMQALINAENSDLFDVLAYVAYATAPLAREERVARVQGPILNGLGESQKQFIAFVLNQYVLEGVEELAEDKLPVLLTLKYHALDDARRILGSVPEIRRIFIDFQRSLYSQVPA